MLLEGKHNFAWSTSGIIFLYKLDNLRAVASKRERISVIILGHSHIGAVASF
jgi:hypothetical protein